MRFRSVVCGVALSLGAVALACGSEAGGTAGPSAADDAGPDGAGLADAGAAPTGDDAGSSDGGSDAGAGTARIACGAGFCRSDEACVQGTCTRPCTGVNVPGDYATLVEAAKALAAKGEDGTICLVGTGDQSVGASPLIEDPARHHKALRIVGVKAGQPNVFFNGGDGLFIGKGFGEVTLEGFSIKGEIDVTPGLRR